MARSYSLQSGSNLQGALDAARAAANKSPGFGFASTRVAELEFSFGRAEAAEQALDQALAASPRNAQGQALKGFLLGARGRLVDAQSQFDRAIEIDPALGNAWLGRGLIKFRNGQTRAGREDLQVAATLEPNRSLLRSYLAKAFAQTWDEQHAAKELALAQKLDPNDPTPWLYSALLAEQQNQINDAISDLEKSKELNENRSVFRSRLLLDQDQAVRGANLAAIYRDANMFDVSVQEAARAVNSDYANFSAHLFLSSSFDALRDPRSINLRYETPWYSELLLANLLAPVGGGSLSQNISQQEYSRFFEGDHFGIFSATEYSTHGDWRQSASQYGTVDGFSYSLDASYQSLNGHRPNNDLEDLSLAARVKYELTPQDSVFVQLQYFDLESGDVAQYYYQTNASQTLRVHEEQLPNLLLGYHHEWSPGNHTLFLAARFDDTLALGDTAPALLWLRTAVNPFNGATNVSVRNPSFLQLGYRSELEAYSAELQQIWETERQSLVAGLRLQVGWPETASVISQQTPIDPAPTPVVTQQFEPEVSRASVYAYENYKLLDNLLLTAGLSYDHLYYPVNVDTAPITGAQADKDKVSPKVGLLWSPLENTHVRGIYTRSLGGVFFDNSIRLEPTQIAGFNQAFRSLVPESVAGLVPGTEFETFGVGFDHRFPTRTYLTIQAELLQSDGTRTVGILTNSDIFVPQADSASSTRQTLDFEERSLTVAVNQLIGQEFALGLRYKVTEADLNSQFVDLSGVSGVAGLNQDVSATLNQLWLTANYNQRDGFFAEFDAIWSHQSNGGYSPALASDDFWQFNLYAGYRFWLRHAEARIGLVNMTDEDYRLNPLTLYNELPRERAVTFSLKFYY
jgi:tetratricopeptide (TPR) repeat protein